MSHCLSEYLRYKYSFIKAYCTASLNYINSINVESMWVQFSNLTNLGTILHTLFVLHHSKKHAFSKIIYLTSMNPYPENKYRDPLWVLDAFIFIRNFNIYLFVLCLLHRIIVPPGDIRLGIIKSMWCKTIVPALSSHPHRMRKGQLDPDPPCGTTLPCRTIPLGSANLTAWVKLDKG